LSKRKVPKLEKVPDEYASVVDVSERLLRIIANYMYKVGLSVREYFNAAIYDSHKDGTPIEMIDRDIVK
jgi:hypothetical protein